MNTELSLNEKEQGLRDLLLDVADHIGRDGERPVLRITGGWVRDKLLGIDSKDIDIGISNMTGFKFGTTMQEFLDMPENQEKYGMDVLGSRSTIAANPEKSKHLETVTTKILGLEIDLVNLRKETYAEDSRNPTMEFGTAEEDALRRDSTVNALFYNLSDATVEDLTGNGLKDMELKIIRTPLEPFQTFKDDPLRVLRCIRFASKLGYRIDPRAVESMSNSDIKNALRLKISRERIGEEVKKMLNGPNPAAALRWIDQLSLYDTIFTDPTRQVPFDVETKSWRRAYEFLPRVTADPDSESLDTIREILLSQENDHYHSWLLCALTPWAEVENPDLPRGNRLVPIAATLAIREGLKADNKTVDIVKNAVLFRKEIRDTKDAVSSSLTENESEKAADNGQVGAPTNTTQSLMDRGNLGMLVRKWGPSWPNSVMFAMLVDAAEVETEQGLTKIMDGYSKFLSYLKELKLLTVYLDKPLRNGKQLQEAVGRGAGQWLAPALDTIMRWQLRNPDEVDPKDAISEVVKSLEKGDAAG